MVRKVTTTTYDIDSLNLLCIMLKLIILIKTGDFDIINHDFIK